MAEALLEKIEPGEKVAPPEPGIYPNVSMDEYFAWDAVSASLLKAMDKAPCFAKAYMDGLVESSDALEFGRAAHTMAFERGRFDEQYLVAGQCEAELGTGKRKGQRCLNAGKVFRHGAWYCGQHDTDAVFPDEAEHLSVISREDYDAIQGMARALRENAEAADILAGRGMNEVSIVWTEPDFPGLTFKARIDRWTDWHGWPTHADLKNVADASERGFLFAVKKFGYHIQGAHYLSGANHAPVKGKKATPAQRKFVFIAQEKKPPYAVGVWPLGPTTLAYAERQRRRLIRRYIECLQADHWPGYQWQELELPPYMIDDEGGTDQ